MSKRRSPETVNTGGASKPKEDGDAQQAIGGNARLEGEDPSPDDRERGERSSKDEDNPVDLTSER